MFAFLLNQEYQLYLSSVVYHKIIQYITAFINIIRILFYNFINNKVAFIS